MKDSIMFQIGDKVRMNNYIVISPLLTITRIKKVYHSSKTSPLPVYSRITAISETGDIYEAASKFFSKIGGEK